MRLQTYVERNFGGGGGSLFHHRNGTTSDRGSLMERHTIYAAKIAGKRYHTPLLYSGGPDHDVHGVLRIDMVHV